MVVDKNGVPFIEKARAGDEFRPYKIWFADRYRCDICGAKILAGFGSESVDEHMPNFKKVMVAALKNEETIIEQERG